MFICRALGCIRAVRNDSEAVPIEFSLGTSGFFPVLIYAQAVPGDSEAVPIGFSLGISGFCPVLVYAQAVPGLPVGPLRYSDFVRPFWYSMPSANPLSRAAAKAYYDRYGLRQDRQHYEDDAVEQLFNQLQLRQARQVVEFGCGTGRWAQHLLSAYLEPEARYWGCDISDTMVATARQRLQAYGERAQVVQIGGDLPLPLEAESCDRILSTYVLDLLPEGEIQAFMAEAQRLLVPGGLMGLASIAPGTAPVSKAVMQGWQWLHQLRPQWLGGCRPLQLAAAVPAGWQINHQQRLTHAGITSEVVVARRAKAD